MDNHPRILIPYKFETGGAMISLGAGIDPSDQVFSFTADGSKETLHFHIPKLRRLAKTNLRAAPEDLNGAARLDYSFACRKTIDKVLAAHIIARNGVEMEYVRRMTRATQEPGLICMFDERPKADYGVDFTEVVADGNHRLVWRVIRGHTEMDFIMIPEPIWKATLLDFSLRLL